MNLRNQKAQIQAAMRRAKKQKIPHAHWSRVTGISSQRISQFLKTGTLAEGIDELEAALRQEGFLSDEPEEPIYEAPGTESALLDLAKAFSDLSTYLSDRQIAVEVRREILRQKLKGILSGLGNDHPEIFV